MSIQRIQFHHFAPFRRLPPLLSTWKNVSRCAWRFIKFELRHGIEFRHRHRRRGSSKELEKPSLERRKWMSGTESRKKSKRTVPVLKRYPANCFWSFQRHPSSATNNPRLRTSIFYKRPLSTTFSRYDLQFLSFAFNLGWIFDMILLDFTAFNRIMQFI